jgi:phenylalanyl-tRNA synthetase beta chain
MKVSEAWLREWVSPSLTSQQLAAQLTMAGLEVDAVSPVAGEFNHVVVALVLETRPHPKADRLTLCSVDAGGQSPIQVVCGASNVRAGLKVALALPDARLPHGLVIKESMLRGELSQGMLCSVSELGLDDVSDGIIEFPIDAPIGVDVREYLLLNDHIFDLDLTPNRADCFSLLGVAREVAALNRLSMQKPSIDAVAPRMADELKIHVTEPASCSKYCGRLIRGLDPHAHTPLWMKERLRRSGVRLTHPIVDVTNYVMLELGQPMHAFDCHLLQGDIQVRFSHAAESLELLDGQQAQLHDKVLVIADDNAPLAIAGVMGGRASAVSETTTDVFLESAFFNPLAIAGVARHYGLSSESSQRFERGVDPGIQRLALERATALLHSIAGGIAGPVIERTHEEHLPVLAEVIFYPDSVHRLIGVVIPEDDMALMLEGLGMMVTRRPSSEGWLVRVPTHRFDVALNVDLVEEIIRLYGYDNIVGTTMEGTMQAGVVNTLERLSVDASLFLSHRGYHETISYSFVDPQFQRDLYPDAQTLSLINPISSELSEMRVALWPGLLAAMVYNMHRQQPVVRFFETGVVFDKGDEQVQERLCLAGIMTGTQGALNWSEPTRAFDFYDMKGDLEALFASLKVTGARFVARSHPALHPGQSARIIVGEQEIGWLGVLHPRFLDALDLTQEVMVFELSLPELCHQNPVRYHSISKYPKIRRDLSLLVDSTIASDDIERAVREVVSPSLLKAFHVFDVYMGESIPQDKKSLAIALTLQDDSRTLVDADIHAVTVAVLKKLYDEFAIVLREVSGLQTSIKE